jgi:ParB family chromosome partitioning protein
MTEPTPEIRSVQIDLITILNPRVRNKRIGLASEKWRVFLR